MELDILRRWNARHLLAAWIAYWLALVIVAIGSPAFRVWRLTHDPGSHGAATVRVRDDVISATVAQSGATVWAGSANLLMIALWLVGPPLLLYILWLRRRPSAPPPRRPAAILSAGGAVPAAVPPDASLRRGVRTSAERGQDHAG